MMKAIMISIKPKYVAKILDGEKTIEIRKGTRLYKAVEKLIKEYGFARFYIYCTKDKKQTLFMVNDIKVFNNNSKTELKECAFALGGMIEVDRAVYEIVAKYKSPKPTVSYMCHRLNGKVVAYFDCYKVEEIRLGENQKAPDYSDLCFETKTLNGYELEIKSCLDFDDLKTYLQCKTGYAIHISNLVIFDKPKELNEFYKGFERKYYKNYFAQDIHKEKNALVQPIKYGYEYTYPLTKAPQSWCYVEAGD